MISVVGRSELSVELYNRVLSLARPQPIYMNLVFLDSIAAFTKSQLLFVLDIGDEGFTSVLPFCVYDGVYGPIINSLPFYGSNGGIVSPNKEITASKRMIDALLSYARSIDCVSVTIIESLLNKESPQVYDVFEYRDHRIGLFNQIHSDSEIASMFEAFESRARNSIRKAIASGVQIINSHSTDSINFLASLHIENMTSAGRRAKSKEFFVAFLDKLPRENWIILEAFLGEKRIASLLLIYNADFVEYFTPVSLPNYKHLNPLSLLIWKGFIFAKEEGIGFWNWGGTWLTQQGVYRFKKQWRPVETLYSYYTTVLDPSILQIDPEDLVMAYPFFYVYPFGPAVELR